jgi:hypothetical protein
MSVTVPDVEKSPGVTMKTMIMTATFLAVVATGTFAADQTWTGAVSDKMCGADHNKMGRKMSDRDCTLACTKGGTPYVLVVDGTAYQLAGHDADLKTHAGHTVNLTGELKGDTIRVSRVEMPKS